MHIQVLVKCMNINQGPVLGCLATDSVSAEGATDVSPFAVRMLGHLLESEPVKYDRALTPGQAVVTKHQGLQPTPA